MITINSNSKKKRLLMLALLLGTFTMLMTETFFNNALPSIISQYHVSQSIAQWVNTGYQLVAGLMIPLSAWIFQSFSLKKTYLSLLFVFLIGSILGALAPNFYCLLLGRLLQAVAAGAMIPIIQNVVIVLYEPQVRGTVMGSVGLVVAFGPAIGPTVSGLIIDNLGLNWLSGILVPWVILILIFSVFTVKSIIPTRNEKIDYISILESSLGFGLLLYTFSEIGNIGAVNFILIIYMIISFALIGLFCRRQFKIANPLLNLNVFKNKIFNIMTLLSAISNIALLGVELVLPLYLQRVHGLSAFIAGLVLLPGALAEGIVSPIAGKIYDKFGIKTVSICGFILLTIGTVPMMTFSLKTNLGFIIITYAIRMIGIALIMMPTLTEGLDALSEDLSVHGNAALSTVRQIAESLGTAILMTLVAFGTRSTSGSEATQLNHGYWYSFLTASLMAAVGVVISMCLKNRKA